MKATSWSSCSGLEPSSQHRSGVKQGILLKILSITAGAAGMYCGSCLRDNALAIELLARGHDVTLVPVYTPTLTDDDNVSRRNVLFGGISVYLQQHSPLFRILPRFLDRLWDSPRLIGMFAGRGISPDARFLGEMTISMLQGERGVLRLSLIHISEPTRLLSISYA